MTDTAFDKSIYDKLFMIQTEVGKVAKESTNPFYNSKYFDINKLIEHVHPLLHKYGLLLMQPIEDGQVKSIIFDPATEEQVISSIPLPNIDDPQAIGKVITYYRRYTLASLLALQAEDDDGNAGHVASKRQQKPWLNEGTKEWQNAETKLNAGEITMRDITQHYRLNKKALEHFQSIDVHVDSFHSHRRLI